jgi:hypothetical protein
MGVRALVIVIAALVLAAAGRAETDDQPCTMIGCESGVTLTMRRTLPRAVFVEACVDSTCRTMRVSRYLRIVFVPTLDVAGEQTVTVRIRVLDARKRVVLSRQRSVFLRAIRPNGVYCPPVCFQAKLLLTGRRLTG